MIEFLKKSWQIIVGAIILLIGYFAGRFRRKPKVKVDIEKLKKEGYGSDDKTHKTVDNPTTDSERKDFLKRLRGKSVRSVRKR